MDSRVVDSVLGSHLRVGFWARIADCCSDFAVTYARSCALARPCKAPFLAQKSCREQCQLESTFEQSPTANKRSIAGFFSNA